MIFSLRIQSASRKNDVEVGGIGSGRRDQPARLLDVGLAQRRLLGGVADQHQPILAAVPRRFRLVVFDDHKWNRAAGQFAGRAAPHASSPTNDVVIMETADFAFHFSPAKEAAQLEF